MKHVTGRWLDEWEREACEQCEPVDPNPDLAVAEVRAKGEPPLYGQHICEQCVDALEVPVKWEPYYYIAGDGWVSDKKHTTLDAAVDEASESIDEHLETCTADIGDTKIDIMEAHGLHDTGERVRTEECTQMAGRSWTDREGNTHYYHPAEEE